MGSKILILLGLSAAFVFLMISSQVTAAEYFAETTSKNGGGHYHGGGGSDSYNGIGPAEIYPSCSHRAPGSNIGDCGCTCCCNARCCSEAEALEATQVKPQN